MDKGEDRGSSELDCVGWEKPPDLRDWIALDRNELRKNEANCKVFIDGSGGIVSCHVIATGCAGAQSSPIKETLNHEAY